MKVKFLSLRKKLVIGVFAISTMVTSISVTLNFYYDYSTEINQLNMTISSIESSILKPLTKLVWDFNESQIQTQIDSLAKLPEVTSVQVIFSGNKKIFFAQDGADNQNNINKKYPLIYVFSGEEKKIGELIITFDKHSVLSKIYDKLALFIALQFIKSFLISLLLIVFFQKLITERLEALSAHVADLNRQQFVKYKKFKLKRLPFLYKAQDEISKLTRIINKMAFRTQKYNQSLNSKLIEAENQAETQRAKAIYASKMATLGEMASGIAHEVNNPLAVIQGRIEMMSRVSKDLPSESQHKFLDNMNKVLDMINRISKIIKGLRSFARDGSEDPLEVVSFQSILNETYPLMKQRLNSKDIQFTAPNDDFKLLCRPVEISQVFLNLVNNSIDAIEKLNNRWIKIEVLGNDEVAYIQIHDSGPGIEPKIVEKLMQPFFTTKEVGKGTGLGLSISKGIIEKIGGQLTINSNFDHTCFEIKLNKAKDFINQKAV